MGVVPRGPGRAFGTALLPRPSADAGRHRHVCGAGQIASEEWGESRVATKRPRRDPQRGGAATAQQGGLNIAH